jgi:radical SAM protein with 4Fe4S-binding SPASM domain
MSIGAARLLPVTPFDPVGHYGKTDFVAEHQELEEAPIDIRNIGWTLGNDCPYRCRHCYSMSARKRGAALSTAVIDRVVGQLAANGVETVNLGGNEPVFTNGLAVRESLLPYIIEQLLARGIAVGLTTAGVTATMMARHFPKSLALLNDMDVSFDSPLEHEHNANRGASIYREAIRALELCAEFGIERTIIMCGMEWNFDVPHLEQVVGLAARYSANIRINPIKPIERDHLPLKLSPHRYYEGFAYLMSCCDVVDLGEPPLAAVAGYAAGKGCPCGRTSFRIHSITPDGTIPVSPCVYLHDYKVGNLIEEDLYDIVRRPEFRTFRRRNARPDAIPGCDGCDLLNICRGGCAARSYLASVHEHSRGSLFVKDPYCPKEHANGWTFPRIDTVARDVKLVHQDYLCTWIGRPRR